MSDGLNQRFFHIGDASIRFVTPLDENCLEMLEMWNCCATTASAMV